MPELEEKQVAYSATNVTITTTTETVVISSGRVPTPRHTCQVLVKAWCLLTTGAATTAVTARIRRGTAATGTLASEENAQTIKAAAGSTEPYAAVAREERAGQDSVEYSLTIQQTDATGNGSVLEAAIEVEVLGG